MKVELERQLAEYGRQVDAEITPLTPSDFEPPAAPTRPRRPVWTVALAAFVLVVVVIGGVALLLPRGGQAPLVDTPDPQPSTPTTAVPPTTVGGVEPEPNLIPGVEGSIYFVARWANPVSEVDVTHAVWYLEADTWRWEIVKYDVETSTEMEGHLLIRDGDSMFEYLPIPSTYTILDPTVECTDTESSPENCVDDVDFDPTVDGELYPPTEYLCDDAGTCVAVSERDTWQECSIGDGGLIAGVPTTRYTCSRQVIVNDVTETESLDLYQHGSSRTMKLDAVVFSEAGQREVTSYEILEIDLAPAFDPGLFEFKCDDCRDAGLPPDPFNHRMIRQVAPPTSGQVLTGGTLDLADHRGERIVFNLWASWCPPCTEELPALQTLSEENDGVTFITAVVLDTSAEASAVVDDLNITMPTLDLTNVPAENNYLSDVWGAFGIPYTFFIDGDGVIVAVQPGKAGVEGLKGILDQLGW